MIDLHYWTTPNGHKIAMFLEETGLPYNIVPVNLVKNEQFEPKFLEIAPNNKMPAIVDRDPIGGGAPISIFESGAILQYLAEKTGKLIPQDIRAGASADHDPGELPTQQNTATGFGTLHAADGCFAGIDADGAKLVTSVSCWKSCVFDHLYRYNGL